MSSLSGVFWVFIAIYGNFNEWSKRQGESCPAEEAMSIFSGGIVRDAPPKDGLWENGKNLGKPPGYRTSGWLEDALGLTKLPEFEFADLVGITREQIIAGLYVTAGGALGYNGKSAQIAGANMHHDFKIYLPNTLWLKEGFQFSTRHWLYDTHTAADNRVLAGVQTVGSDDAPFTMQGATSSHAYYGYWNKTGASSNTILRTFGAEGSSGNMSGFSYKFLAYQVFPQAIRLFNMKTAIARYRITNGSNEYYIDDPRPTGLDEDEYFYRPFIEINVRLFSQNSIFTHVFHDFCVSGVPKTI